ncbi:uncharacterized protein LOC113272831 [Papaver somniferum]|uniref:uncharacterized protein LOC113272831 n=1 Tax=Papaver somniferum TaxID=3469 RepID=UPI000E7003A0|nr:uncharacterized protein LOC113272831 [Papaver somniferum]
MLSTTAASYNLPWLIIGDFKFILHDTEKFSTHPMDKNEADIFKEKILELDLIYLGFTGFPFTWSNKRKGHALTEQRLDRVLATDEWLAIYPNTTITNMLAIGSDHHPIFLNSNPNWKNGKIPFKFFVSWLDHEDSRKIIADCWKKSISGSSAFIIARKLKDIKLQSRVWNKEVHGNIKANIEENDRGQALANARKQLKNWFDIEEQFWKTKSRDQLINLGDQNTSYFHRATKSRTRRNKIEAIQDEEGKWITEDGEVKNCFTNHFSQMATAEPINPSTELINLIPSNITNIDNMLLNRKPEPDEIKAILFIMASDKAPRPGGFPPNFFKSNWDIIGAGIVKMVQNFFSSGIKICKVAPSISHLLFADDCMIFCKANLIEAQNIMKNLQLFGSTSGQLINFNKSGVFFSKNTNPSLIPKISGSMGVQVLQLDDKYLGSPLFTHRSKISSFKPGVEKMKLRLSGWKYVPLNPEGREVLIKSVTSSACIYQMNCFKVPKKTCKDLDKLQRDFFWGENIENPTGYYPKAWTSVCKQKELGGLGFMNLELLNSSMITKIGWRLEQDKYSMWYKLMDAKYLIGRNVLNMDTK